MTFDNFGLMNLIYIIAFQASPWIRDGIVIIFSALVLGNLVRIFTQVMYVLR